MKSFIVFAITALVVVQSANLSEEQIKKLRSHHEECGKVSGITTDVIEQFRKGQFPDGNIKLKEHLFCVSKKIGAMNEQGEIVKDVLKAKLSTVIDSALASKLIDECAVKKATPPQTAYDSLKCFHEKTPQHINIV